MADTFSGLTLGIRPHPGDSNLLELGVEVDGGFYGLQLLKRGRFEKIAARAAADKAAADKAAATPAEPSNG